MKEQFKKALDMLRKKVTWLAKNNKLKKAQLEDYNFMFKSFTEYYNNAEKRAVIAEEQMGEFNMQLSQVLVKQEKLFVIAQLTGVTKGILNDLLNIELHYLNNELSIAHKNQNWLQSQLQVAAFIQNHRLYKSLIEADIQTVYEYEGHIQTKQGSTYKIWTRFLETYRENFPHLSHYFKQIEAEGKFNPYFKPHLYNALDSRYLWKN